MWVDENGVVHTVHVEPEVILGEKAVRSLRALDIDVRESALDELDDDHDRMYTDAVAEAPLGPSDPGLDTLEALSGAPRFPGLLLRPDEPIVTTIRRYLRDVPGRWRLVVYEAVCDALDEPFEQEADSSD